MKIKIQKQFNKSGDEYLNEEEIEIEITKVDDEIWLERKGMVLCIPVEAFIGILSS